MEWAEGSVRCVYINCGGRMDLYSMIWSLLVCVSDVCCAVWMRCWDHMATFSLGRQCRRYSGNRGVDSV